MDDPVARTSGNKPRGRDVRADIVRGLMAICSLFASSECFSAPGDPVSVRQARGRFLVRNGYYEAHVDRLGNLVSVRELGGTGTRVFKNEHIELTTADHLQPFDSAAFIAPTIQLLDARDFYVQLQWKASLDPERTHAVRSITRTYEFTRSPHIFEQLVIEQGGGAFLPPVVTALAWSIERSDASKGAISSLGADLLAELPDFSSYGGSGGDYHRVSPPEWAERCSSCGPGEWSLSCAFCDPAPYPRASPFSTGTVPTRIVVKDGHMQSSYGHATEAHASILAQTVFSVVPAELGPNESLGASMARFCPGYGLYDRHGDRWDNWNVYASPAEELLPLKRKYVESPTSDDWLREDLLIRFGAQFVRRISLDGGWPAWKRIPFSGHPVYTTVHARALPSLAYLWSYLSCDANGKHRTSDADYIYDALVRGMRPFYATGDRCSKQDFEDFFPAGLCPRPWSVDCHFPWPGICFYPCPGGHYLSYSSRDKECGGSDSRDIRILNSHAHALHFAWILRSAAYIMRDASDIKSWGDVLRYYHEGSKALYRRAIPGTRDGIPHSGTVDYGVPYDRNGDGHFGPAETWGINKIDYNDITHNAIPAGYQYAGEYEPEFINTVERACKLDYDVTDGESKSAPDMPFVARLVRTIPLALVYAGDDVSMSAVPPSGDSNEAGVGNQAIVAGELRELDAFARAAFRDGGLAAGTLWRKYDPAQKRPIVIGRDKVVWTNKAFTSDWLRGFWEEMNPERIPLSKRFWAAHRFPPHGPGGGNHLMANPYWVVYRSGNAIEAMAGFKGGNFILKLPVRSLRYEETYRDYDPTTMRWRDWVTGTTGNVQLADGHEGPLELVLGTPVLPKRIIRVIVASSDLPDPGRDVWIEEEHRDPGSR